VETDEMKEEEMEEDNKGRVKKEEHEENKFEQDSFKRFEVLFKKTEKFSHCLDAGDAAEGAGGSSKVVKKGRGRPSKGAGPIGDHRHRKTEKEEDEEILAQDEKASKPSYSMRVPRTSRMVNFVTTKYVSQLAHFTQCERNEWNSR
ncbi:hypothetical protein PFISCL1PPCAC_25940, partial [Pristionchus fissidentatus]